MNFFTSPVMLVMAAMTLWSVSCNHFINMLDESERCARSSSLLWPCLKKSGAQVVGAMLDYHGEIPLIGPYLTVVPDRDQNMHDEARGSTTNRTFSVYSKLLDFAEKRLLRVSLPMNAVTWLVNSPTEIAEGRGKKDKGQGVLMLGGMMMITTLLSTAFGSLALMAAKGLLTSILALMLSAMAISKKSGGHGHARTTYEIINGPPHQRYQQMSDYKLENAAVVSEVSSFNYYFLRNYNLIKFKQSNILNQYILSV